MWIGKLAIVMYSFAAICLFVGSMFEYGLGLDWSIFSGWTEDALNELTGENDVDVAANPNLVFGDFFAWGQAVGTLLFNGVSGGIVQDAFSQLPFWNEQTMLLTRFLYTFSTFILGLHIGTGRLQ